MPLSTTRRSSTRRLPRTIVATALVMAATAAMPSTSSTAAAL
jgi:hypothetical protein